MSIRYRPEIDGLRAVAVLGVLFCHAGISLFSGGFVGVDVFFVISGFLITSLIVKDLEERVFSFAGFWERRIRRILPPLIVVIVASLVAGWFLYLPSDYDNLGQQTASQAIFASNILFKAQSGYFDSQSFLKPLLHTWSLAVEEQFYLLFPVALYFAWKHRPESLFKYLAIFSVLSFIGACVLVRHSPDSAFYLLPFRAWELLVGALIALHPKELRGQVKEIAGVAGLAAILGAMVLYTDKTTFPGATALLPCLGAAAIIISNTGQQNFTGRLLAMKIPVFTGAVSYSLYLWHWPVLVFVKYSQLFEITTLIKCICLGSSFVLAVLSWKYIETPFRQKKILPARPGIYKAALVSLLVLCAFGGAAHVTRGFPERLPADVAKYAQGSDDTNPFRDDCNKPKFDRFKTGDICQSNKDSGIKPDFVLWGDSFADAIAPAFYDLSKRYGKNGYVVTADGCSPILGFRQQGKLSFNCVGFNNRVFDMIKIKNIKRVFLVAHWSDRMRNPESIFDEMDWYKNYRENYDDVTMAALKRTTDELQRMGVTVYIMIDVPGADFDPPRLLAMKKLYHADSPADTIGLKDYKRQRGNKIDEFVEKNYKSGIVFIDPVHKLCTETECKVQEDGRSLYYNQGHLSKAGALYLEDLIEPYLH